MMEKVEKGVRNLFWQICVFLEKTAVSAKKVPDTFFGRKVNQWERFYSA
jgi:hypothetical protein